MAAGLAETEIVLGSRYLSGMRTPRAQLYITIVGGQVKYLGSLHANPATEKIFLALRSPAMDIQKFVINNREISLCSKKDILNSKGRLQSI